MSSGPLGLLQNGWEGLLAFLLFGGAIIVAIGLHEFAHAAAADLQGDRLPRAMGRLTVNPLRHLDPLGTILIFIAGFGWGKPVEFRLSALSSKRFGAAIVALAGPAMNVFLGLLGAFALRVTNPGLLSLLAGRGQIFDLSTPSFVDMFLATFMTVNVVLAVFNLIPVPPLDGSRLLTIFLPPDKQKIVFFLDRYGFLILLAVVFLGPRTLFNPLIDGVLSIVAGLTGL
jgi:Zn-dependent protease